MDDYKFLNLPFDHKFPKPNSAVMYITRIKSRLSSLSPAPPPSPLPSARGSRSDPAFNHYLEKPKHIPDVNLPDYVNRSIIADIEYRLIKSKDKYSINEMLRSAFNFGVFRISGHGIPVEELQAAFTEAEFCFGLLAERWSRDGDREEFSWSRSTAAMAERRREVTREEKFRKFSHKMENLASKLETIASEVAEIIGNHGGKQPRKKIKENETRMTLFKHNNSSLQPHTPRSSQTPRATDGSRPDSCTFALSLHLPTETGDFCLLSEEGPLSFRTGPDTIVFTIGEQLQEWSCGEYKAAYGEINIEPDVQWEQGAFSVELKCSPSNTLNDAVDRINTISIPDQIFLLLALTLLYKFLSFLFS